MANQFNDTLSKPSNALLLWSSVGLICVAILIAYSHSYAWDRRPWIDHASFAVHNITMTGFGSDVVFDEGNQRKREAQKYVVLLSSIVGTLAFVFFLSSIVFFIVDSRRSKPLRR